MRYLFSLFLFVSTAYALPARTVNIVAVNGPNTLSDAQIFDLVLTARRYSELVRLPLKLGTVYRVNEVSPHVTLDTRVLRLYDYIQYARHNKLYKHGAYLIFVVPLIEDEGKKYYAGLARVACASPVNRVAWATGSTLPSSLGASWWSMTNSVFNHELWHLLGAFHDDFFYGGTATLMHSNALSFLRGDMLLPVSQKSRKEVKRCQKKQKF